MRKFRAEARQTMFVLSRDPEAWDAIALPIREPVGKAFDDKLGPVERWLRSKVGRPWSNVRSEIASRFDTRSLAGRHIVFCHLLPRTAGNENERDGWRVFRRGWFRVDDEGVLRVSSTRPGPTRTRWGHTIVACFSARAEAFVGKRSVGRVDARLYWFERTREPEASVDPIPWRQHVELSEAERTFYFALCERERLAITLEPHPTTGKPWLSPDVRRWPLPPRRG